MGLVDLSQSVRRTRLHEQVAKTLCLRVLNNDLPPDSILPNEDSLAEQFGVSKPVIREAMSFMEAKGLVEVRPRVGTRICDPSNWVLTDPVLMKWQMESGTDTDFIQEMLELRGLIEPLAAGLAAERASSQKIANIEDAFLKMETAKTVNDHIHADMLFHLSIVAASGNKLLTSALKPILENTLGSSFSHFIQSIDAAKSSLPVHRAVVTAIKDKNPEQAIAAAKKVIGRYAEDIDKLKNDSDVS